MLFLHFNSLTVSTEGWILFRITFNDDDDDAIRDEILILVVTFSLLALVHSCC